MIISPNPHHFDSMYNHYSCISPNCRLRHVYKSFLGSRRHSSASEPSGFSSFFTGAIRQNRELESNRTQHILRESSSYIQGRKHKSGSRCALHSSDFHLHTENIFSIHQPHTTSDGCIKPLPLIRLSFVFEFFDSGAGGQVPSVFLGQLRCFTSTFASVLHFFSEGLLLLRRSRELGTLLWRYSSFSSCFMVRNRQLFYDIRTSSLRFLGVGIGDCIQFERNFAFFQGSLFLLLGRITFASHRSINEMNWRF
jgi:hypothetical protein